MQVFSMQTMQRLKETYFEDNLSARHYIGYSKETIRALLCCENGETVRLERNDSKFAKDIWDVFSSQTDICIQILMILDSKN